MLLSYLKRVVETLQGRKLPVHPHASRCWQLSDNTVVVADTTDETEMDKVDLPSVCPSVTDLVNSGQKLQSIMPAETTILTASQFAEKFLAQFQLAGAKDAAAIAAQEVAAAGAKDAATAAQNPPVE